MAVNPAFTRITGYAGEDVVGKSPNLLKSDRHDDQFYSSKWGSLKENGYWTGEVWNKRKDGNVTPMMETISACTDRNGNVTNYISVIVDISEMKDAQTLIKFLAYHDPLTGLPNRIVAREHFDEVASTADACGNMAAVIWFDIDRFKVINDSIGHAIGDQVLKILAGELLSRLNDADKVTRQGGDEFLMVSGNIETREQANSIARELIDLVNRELIVDGHRLSINTSLGIALYPEHGKTLDDLLRSAENALYQAKKDGGNTYRFFTEDMSREAMRKLEMQTLLHAALDNRELDVFYQPKIELKSGNIVGTEALLRWHNPKLGSVSPAAFIPCAEETGLIHSIGEWVLNTVCSQINKWREDGLGEIHVSVNLSAHQFLDKNLGRIVERAITAGGIPAQLIELEITESILMADITTAAQVLQGLKEIGVTISLDDFGTGYSSLSYLKNLPIDTLKIDKSFIDEVHASPSDAAIALTIIALSRNLGLGVVAEGVENREQYVFLQNNGCDMVQGFYISKPLPAADFARMARLGSAQALKGNVA
jgi:diguanylate cyclase (GGDEF)-like protein/PAS domain S-box-containing protein